MDYTLQTIVLASLWTTSSHQKALETRVLHPYLEGNTIDAQKLKLRLDKNAKGKDDDLYMHKG